jgi:hypothetical protein
LDGKTLKLAMQGQIFDEGTGLLLNSPLRKYFSSPGAGSRGGPAGAPARQVFD